MPRVEVVPEVGVRYEVTVSDCCVSGLEFTAMLTAIDTCPDEGSDEPGDLIFWGFTFDNGVVIDSGHNAGVILEAVGS